MDNGIIICNPPLNVDSALLFASEHLDCDFIMKRLSESDSKALIVAYASSPEYPVNIDSVYTKDYKERGYVKVRGLSSSMVDSIE